jgi:phage repressor protein C with HTH and peptisase S24 domain
MPSDRKARILPEHLAEADRLRQLWTQRPTGARLSQEEFGERYGIGNQSAVGQFLRGQTPLSIKAARGFVQGLNDAGVFVRLRDISPRLHELVELTRRGEPEVSEPEFVDVPRTSIALSAGAGREPHFEVQQGSLKFRTDFLRAVGANRQSACIVDVVGHSMEPTIPDGAVVLISRSAREPRDRQIYALRIGTELFVKRLVLAHGNWFARSDNADRDEYPDVALTAVQDVEILGRAVWMGAKL